MNVVEPDLRLPILDAILDLCKNYALLEVITPQFKNVKGWLKAWNVSALESERVFTKISDMAEDRTVATQYAVEALKCYTEEGGSPELAKRALDAALADENSLNVDDLLLLPAVQKLQASNPMYKALLELLSTGTYSDMASFKSSHPNASEAVDLEIIERKIRLLTLATIASQKSDDHRVLPYSEIASALQIQDAEVEMWVIDAIRAGLVEGKLSQPSKSFLIHRATYRVFEEAQWRELDARLSDWKQNLLNIVAVIERVDIREAGDGLIYGESDQREDEDAELDEDAESEVDAPAQQSVVDES